MDGFVLPAMNSSLFHPYSRLFLSSAHQAVHADSGAVYHSTKDDPLTAARLKSSLRASSGDDVNRFGSTRVSAAAATHAHLERRADRAQDPGHLKWSTTTTTATTTERLLQRAYNFHRELRTTDYGFHRECYLGNLAVGKHPLDDVHRQLYARAAVLSSIISMPDRTHTVSSGSGLNCGDHFRTRANDHSFQFGRAVDSARSKREYYSYNSQDLSLGTVSLDVRRPDRLKSRSNPTARNPEFKVATEVTSYLTQQHSEQKTLDYSNFRRQQDQSLKLQELKVWDNGRDSEFVMPSGEVKSPQGQLQGRDELPELTTTTTSADGARISLLGEDDSSKRPSHITAESPEKSAVYPTFNVSPPVSEDAEYYRPRGNSRKIKMSQKKRRERLYHRQKLASRDGASDQPSSRLHAVTPRGKGLRMRKKPQEDKDRCRAQWLSAGKAESASAPADDHDNYYNNSSSAEHDEFDDDSTSNGDPRCGKTFTCTDCRYRTDRKNNLKRHVVTMHQKSTRVLECCGTLFHSKASLRDHVALFHRGGYRCQLCGRNFCRKALLRRHLTVHSGQKDFSCHLCGYATSHKSNLERHQRVHARKISVAPSTTTTTTLRGLQPFVSRPALGEHAKGPETYHGEPPGERYQGNTHNSFVGQHVDRHIISRSPQQQLAKQNGDFRFTETDNMGATAQPHERDAQDPFNFDRSVVDPLPPSPPPLHHHNHHHHHHLESEDDASSSTTVRANGFLKAERGAMSPGTENNTADYGSPSPTVTEPPCPCAAEPETPWHERTASAKDDPETSHVTAAGSEEADAQPESSVRRSPDIAPGSEPWQERVATLQTKNETDKDKAWREEAEEEEEEEDKGDEEPGLVQTKENVGSSGDGSTPPELTDTHFPSSECLTLSLCTSNNSNSEEWHGEIPPSPTPDLHAGSAEFEFEDGSPGFDIQAPSYLQCAREASIQKARRVLSRKSCFPNRLKETHIASQHVDASSIPVATTTSNSSQNTVAVDTYDNQDKTSVEATKENRSPSENPNPLPEVVASTTGTASASGCALERKRKHVGDTGHLGSKVTGEQVHSSKSRMCCRPYSCFGCGVSFAFQGALRSHVCREKVGGDVLDFPLISAVRKGCIKLSLDQETH